MKTQVLLLCTLLSAAGCAMEARWPEPEQRIIQATGLSNAIELRIDPGPADADQPILDNYLSLTQAIEDALHQSPQIQMALWRVRSAQAQTHQARLLPNPVLSVMVRWSEGGGTPMVEAGLAADLLSLLNKPGEIDLADNQLRAASAQAVTAALDVLAELQTVYAQVQSQDALIIVLEEQLRLVKQMVDLSQSKLEAGEGTRVDVTTLDSQRIELQVVIAQHRLLHRQNRLALARLIGSPTSNADWTLAPWTLDAAMHQTSLEESQWLKTAMEHRPELQALISQLAAAGAQVKLTNLFWIEGGDQGASAERESQGDWSIGPAIAVPLPIFDWGQAKRKQAKALRTQSLYELQAATRQVIQEVRQAHIAWKHSLQILKQVEDELIPLLLRREDETSAAYRAGQIDVLSVILARNDLQASQAKQIELKRQTAEAFIALQRAAGGPGRVAAAAATTQPSETSSTVKPAHAQPQNAH